MTKNFRDFLRWKICSLCIIRGRADCPQRLREALSDKWTGLLRRPSVVSTWPSALHSDFSLFHLYSLPLSSLFQLLSPVFIITLTSVFSSLFHLFPPVFIFSGISFLTSYQPLSYQNMASSPPLSRLRSHESVLSFTYHLFCGSGPVLQFTPLHL